MNPAIFNFSAEQSVRVINRNGAPWFVAADVCGILGIKNPTDALKALEADEKHTLGNSEGIALDARAQQISIISESGLYALILRSRKPEAKRFRRWVTGEVLPAIRKTGRYEVQPVLSAGAPALAPTATPDMAWMVARATQGRLDGTVAAEVADAVMDGARIYAQLTGAKKSPAVHRAIPIERSGSGGRPLPADVMQMVRTYASQMGDDGEANLYAIAAASQVYIADFRDARKFGCRVKQLLGRHFRDDRGRLFGLSRRKANYGAMYLFTFAKESEVAR